MLVLKRDASDNIVNAVQAIEDSADRCYESRAILKRPANVAIWSTLTYVVTEQTEKEIWKRGVTANFTALMLNSGRALNTCDRVDRSTRAT
jgi:hypothetical protein